MFIADIMSTNVKTVTKSATLTELADIFQSVSFRHLLVEEDGELVGVISDRDVIKNKSPFLGSADEREIDLLRMDIKTEAIMSTNSITVDPETLIDSASILLIENNISCLPVVDETNQIKGIVSWKDILQFHVYG